MRPLSRSFAGQLRPEAVMKALLVPTEQHDLMTSTLETALLLARKFDSYIEGFALRPAIDNFAAMDPVSSMAMATVRQHDEDAAKQARGMFEGFMESRGIPRGDKSNSSLSFGWFDAAPDGDNFVGSYGRVFDLTVLGRPGDESQSPRMVTLEAALFESGRPVLIAPPAPPQRLGENVLIAWNGSTEQARATAVVTVSPEKRSTGEALLLKADALGCDLLVKGAYTQSRLRQMIFGGTTRHILASAQLPVLMAH